MIEANVLRGHDALWAKFYNDQTSLVYDMAFTDPSWFPTDQEIAAEYPSCGSWGTGIEDCCLNAGLILDGMVRAHRVTGQDVWAQKARKLYNGLVNLATISGTKGFIARGFVPGSRRVYPNSSTDQYTTFVYGMWSYYHSSIATDKEKRTAAQLVVDAARRVESFDDNIPRLDGRPSIYGDTSSLRPDRACRLLEFYKAAYDLSGDEHWQEAYLCRVNANGQARISSHYGPENWPADRNTHSLIQNQVVLHLLCTVETDPAIRHEYREGMRRTARCILYRIALWPQILKEPMGRFTGPKWRGRFAEFLTDNPDYDPSLEEHVRRWHTYRKPTPSPDEPTPQQLAQAPRTLPWLRHQVEALAVVLLCEEEDLRRQAAAEGKGMLETVDWTLVGDTRVWASLDLAYWRGREVGLFDE